MLFGVIILNAATNPKNILKLENPLLNFLGRISYGLYMYHSVIIVLVLILIKDSFSDPLIHIISIALTIIIAALSYKYFEYPFIKMKRPFSKIMSGELAKD